MTFRNIIAYTERVQFALTGAFKRTHKMDVLVAWWWLLPAYGGTVRDLLIGVRPVNWVNR